jgi:hypothetical protein
LKTLTRVEKYRKLREEITRMPDDGGLSNGQSGSITSKIIRRRPQESIDVKAPRSTIEYGIEDILEGVENSEIEEEEKKFSPIDVQKRKELNRSIILISILVVLLVGVVILGVYAF